MSRRSLVLVLLAITVPAAAQTFGFGDGTSAACLSIGNTSYRLVSGGDRADVTVRIDPAAQTPDIRIQLTETTDEADFVFIEDGETPSCAGVRARTVKIDAQAAAPDLTIGLARASVPPDYRIYVRARSLAPEAAAALYAAAQIPRRLANRAN